MGNLTEWSFSVQSDQTQVSDQTGLSGQALLLYLKAVGGWWVSEFGL